jgi:hypothetical protein
VLEELLASVAAGKISTEAVNATSLVAKMMSEYFVKK